MNVGIWIKSQDGNKLVKARDIELISDSESNYYGIGYRRINSLFCELGTYPTEAQAKRVLDEIEVYIRESEFLRRNRTGGYQDTVYHMPPAEQEG